MQLINLICRHVLQQYHSGLALHEGKSACRKSALQLQVHMTFLNSVDSFSTSGITRWFFYICLFVRSSNIDLVYSYWKECAYCWNRKWERVLKIHGTFLSWKRFSELIFVFKVVREIDDLNRLDLTIIFTIIYLVSLTSAQRVDFSFMIAS